MGEVIDFRRDCLSLLDVMWFCLPSGIGVALSHWARGGGRSNVPGNLRKATQVPSLTFLSEFIGTAAILSSALDSADGHQAQSCLREVSEEMKGNKAHGY